MADPILARLVADVDRAASALRAYVTGLDDQSDLIPISDAAAEFHRSPDTLKRWARDEALGEKVGGRWFLRRSLVAKFKRR